jgi:aldose 1-epimerase
MFKVRIEDFFGKEKIKLYNQSSGEYLSVIPAFGGNINELVLVKNGLSHNIIAGDTTLETLSGSSSNFYRGAKLSPFPNRINSGEYMFGENEYQLEKNEPPHALHGLFWNLPFMVQEYNITGSFARLILQADYKPLHTGFPFSYSISIEYTLEQSCFKCVTRIINAAGRDMPIGDGWHPYFTTGSTINLLKLQIPDSKRLEMNKSLIPTGNYLPGHLFAIPTLLNDTLLDDCFELDSPEGIAETKLLDEDKNVSIVVWQKTGDRGYNFIQVYTHPDRNSIAIEPMSCAPDVFNNGNGLIILSPKESIEFCFGVRLE